MLNRVVSAKLLAYKYKCKCNFKKPHFESSSRYQVEILAFAFFS